ncbi:MAG: sigma-70 family RNA polymerase sigma factor [Planctomycetota bacterium]
MGPIDSIERRYQRYRRSRSSRELSAVFTELNPHLLAAARRAGLDASEAEDVVQETLLASIRGHERFDEDRPFMPWVRGILDRQIKAERRRRARIRALRSIGEASEPSALAANEADDGPMARAELRAKLRTAIDGLSERNAPVVAAALLEGESLSVIAARLGITKSAAAVRLHRGLRQVRDRLGERSSLALLAWTLPRHGKVLPGVLPNALLGETALSALIPTMSMGAVWTAAGTLLALVLGLWAFRSGGESVRVSPALESAAASADGDAASRPGTVMAAHSGPDTVSMIPGERGGRAPAASASIDQEAAPQPQAVELIRGGVVMEGGGPLPADVQVYLLETRPQLVLPKEPLQSVAAVDADGRFEVDLSRQEGDRTPVVMARAPGFVGYADLLAEHRSQGELPDIEIHPDVKIILNVTGEDGEPIEGVKLSGMTDSTRFQAPVGPKAEAFGYIAIDPYHHLFGAVTDESGRGVIEGLFGFGGQGLLLVFSATKPGYARCTEAYLQDDGHDLEVDIVLRRIQDLTLKGTVFGESSQPLPGTEVRFRARGEAALSDAVVARTNGAGQWSIPPELLDEYPIFLSISKPGFGDEELILEGPEKLDGVPIETRLRRSAPLRGRVTDEAGAGIAGVHVEVTTRSHTRLLETDESGAFLANGLTQDPRHVLAIESVAGVPARSVRVASSADSDIVTLVLPTSPVIDSVTFRHSGGVAFKRVELIPLEVESAVEPLQANKIEGETATFTDVFVGQWLAAAMTEEDLTCFRVVDLQVGAAAPVLELETVQLGGIDAWIGEGQRSGPGLVSGAESSDVDGFDLAAGEPGLLIARRLGLPGLPPWLDQSTSVPLGTFYSQVTPGKALEIVRMIPGTWEIMATGPGWSIDAQTVEIGPGEVVSLDLSAKAALPVTIAIGPIHRSARMLLEFRQSEDEPWKLASLVSLATGLPQEEALWLQPGLWSWRATVAATNDDGEWFELMPSIQGEMELRGEEGARLELWP